MGSFKIIEHVLAGQHIREHPHTLGTGRQEGLLHIAIKQYIPIDRPEPAPDNAVTIIALHANGIPKELYEPLWETLYDHLKQKSIPLRGIWIADTANHGASYVLNEDKQGDTTNLFDHSRDLLHMVNCFRDEMPRPLIGIAHSMGCSQLVNLATIHPRLLSTIILVEPVIFVDGWYPPFNPARFAAKRHDLWDSREAAETDLRQSCRRWDPRVVDLFLRYGIRPVPTRLYNNKTKPDLPPGAVTLTTTKYQEMWQYNLANVEPESAGLDHLLLPDWDTKSARPLGYARPECCAAMRNLPSLRPSVLFVYGSRSPWSSPDLQTLHVSSTGVGTGGSGGIEHGKVKKAVLEKGSHVLLLEDVDWSAQTVAEWVQQWFQGWVADERLLAGYQSKRSEPGMLKASEVGLQTSLARAPGSRPKEKL
ncbi:Alpha/beta hydrolase fold-1 domain-containing protein [Penicillium ucsense]|uniref:Alpha/beta hydrolase fold-1 domain-containing protein n=1 Tax=Penicillium ucsense TaxID=2839758 RepID=A0A8J8W096_9EURO|nr:Alpha/beta hydrolase fold-1 domain-containing protein [Penicillium ucsense]KAF7734613.1 Alpha/beta hydrolase fold-1 domain-containing protein [Penicillium ucsense]